MGIKGEGNMESGGLVKKNVNNCCLPLVRKGRPQKGTVPRQSARRKNRQICSGGAQSKKGGKTGKKLAFLGYRMETKRKKKRKGQGALPTKEGWWKKSGGKNTQLTLELVKGGQKESLGGGEPWGKKPGNRGRKGHFL